MNPFVWIERALAFVAGAALVLVLSSVYWNGLPWLNDDPTIDIPVIGEVSLSDVPFFGNVAIGHLEAERRKAAEQAIAGYVSRLELIAEQARSRVLQAQIQKMQKAQADADEALAKFSAAEKEDSDALDRAKADSSGGTRWTQSDLDRLRDYRSTRRGTAGAP